jgi:hypothetical protein
MPWTRRTATPQYLTHGASMTTVPTPSLPSHVCDTYPLRSPTHVRGRWVTPPRHHRTMSLPSRTSVTSLQLSASATSLMLSFVSRVIITPPAFLIVALFISPCRSPDYVSTSASTIPLYRCATSAPVFPSVSPTSVVTLFSPFSSFRTVVYVSRVRDVASSAPMSKKALTPHLVNIFGGPEARVQAFT